MNKLLCDIAFSVDTFENYGEFTTEVLNEVVCNCEGRYPTWEEVEAQIMMSHYGYDVKEWKVDCIRVKEFSVAYILTHIDYDDYFATCIIRFEETK